MTDMGEYWKPVNMTRGEFIHPHNQGCGLKLAEWLGYDNPVTRLMKERWNQTDDVRAVSDSGNEMQICGRANADDSPAYSDLEGEYVEIGLGETGAESASHGAEPTDQ